MSLDLPSFPWEGSDDGCGCAVSFERPVGTGVDDRVVLEVDAGGCPGGGDLAASPDCLATVVEALTERDADVVRTEHAGKERAYTGRAAACLLATGRFRERVEFHEARLAERAARDPVATAREATGRAGPVSRIAAETGLAETVADVDRTADLLRPHVGPTVSATRIASTPPPRATLVDRWELDTDATVRLYEGEGPLRTYHLTPPSARFDDDAFETLAAATERLLSDPVGGERAPGRAVRAVASDDDPVPELTDTLRRHTHGYGAFEHVFADDRVSDATLSAPVSENPLRVVLDGERCRTNVRLPPEGAATLASRLRRTSGRGFSRATPTLDATLETESGSVRVAATTAPASDGLSFTFRRGDPDAWTLARLVAVGTLPAAAAGLLSLAVERGVSGLVAGGRGAGKTTALGSLLWELPADSRTVLIEDTPELPATALTAADRDVQRLNVGDGTEPTPREAVRTALRLGGGALVVGEVRGEEATALYEAMRVGAAGETVLGTIHGEDPAAVRERVVADLGVSPSSFAATDLLVILNDHRVETVVEVTDHAGEVTFDALFEREGERLVATGRVDRGESRLVAGLAGGGETYADVRSAIGLRTERIRTAVDDVRTTPERYAGFDR
ncbi:type II secretion protein [Halorubrum sp. 48-1-W]|uniref:ATPase, T2SS/T4P/T4SS family n=1 Tax=Halorubrum sp. 48-1-W TaxID=2249761 RepID=UPI000DCE0B1E|nr:ATPase, T2SS/T4P/T4SS family [Halorubrum sp. 48-1-W]RAW44604.1 type II secretion protein [Halorubrum sp. 48-1-W]